MRTFLLVVLGGAAGTAARYLVALALGGTWRYPVATLAVNVAGSFAIGLVAGVAGEAVGQCVTGELVARCAADDIFQVLDGVLDDAIDENADGSGAVEDHFDLGGLV